MCLQIGMSVLLLILVAGCGGNGQQVDNAQLLKTCVRAGTVQLLRADIGGSLYPPLAQLGLGPRSTPLQGDTGKARSAWLLVLAIRGQPDYRCGVLT